MTGIIYIFTGLFLFVSPIMVGKFFMNDLSGEWLHQMKMVDQWPVFLYILMRVLAILLTIIGCSMVLPLFDPLKYRGLIYFTCVLFPLGAALFLFSSYFCEEVDLVKKHLRETYHAVVVFAWFFFIIFLVNISALFLTKRNATRGIE
jgi:hypothetical protein